MTQLKDWKEFQARPGRQVGGCLPLVLALVVEGSRAVHPLLAGYLFSPCGLD